MEIFNQDAGDACIGVLVFVSVLLISELNLLVLFRIFAGGISFCKLLNVEEADPALAWLPSIGLSLDFSRMDNKDLITHSRVGA